ncbi:MAG: AAA family ATPase [Lachnospiraceae bacterium]|nr:AAA family ATPase [Lachnospiraceae bacterium]
MRLQALRIQNYKSFRDSGWLEIGKLTLLLGYNSNGKSTVLKALDLLRKCCDCQQMGLETPPFTPEQETDGSFGDILFQGKSKSAKAITFSLRFLNDNNNAGDEFGYSKTLEVVVSARFNKARTSAYIQSVFVSMDGETVYEAAMDEAGIGTARVKGIPGTVSPLFKIQNTFFFVSRPEVMNDPQLSGMAMQISGNVNLSLVDFAGNLEYIMPVRATPSRSMSLSAISGKSVGIDGSGTYNYLYTLATDSREAEEHRIQHWLGLFGYEYYWKKIKANYGAFMLRDLSSGYTVNIVDTGMGISQILPIIVASCMDSADILLIDSPEAHLHPRLQSEFANMFVEAAKKRDVVLETHSQNILLRVERMIAEQKIPADFVRCYFIKDQGESSVCEEIRLDHHGNPIEPSLEFQRFFATAYEDVMDILQAKGRMQ